ncbi:BNR-4 repeat-containing protein, partial [Empedobacter brevis]|uniref:BNR-4 repeat-containing protein n=1 Tax=Empedobacter brevis TaxID=247 RepID=UPI00333EF16D
IGYTAEDGAVKDYIDSMKPNTDKEIVMATSKDMVGRLINSNNGDGLNGSYLGFRNILLPKNTIKLRYTGIKTNSASTLDFAPLIGVKFDGTHETILPLTISTTNFEETVEISVPKGKYYAVSYCSRATSNAKIVAIVDEIDLTEQKRKEYLFSNNNESVQKIPRLASAEAGWYSTFTQNTCVTRGEFTFGFFVEGSSAALVVFRINNNTGEVVYNNLLINNSFRRSAADGHNAYSITISRDGYIIISGNCHNEKPDSAISDKPLDISKFNNWDYTGATDVSYPRFALSPNGDLFAFYRRGGSGNGNTYFAKFNDDIKQFNTPIILIDAISENAGNPYLQTPVIDRNGVIKIAFGFRRSASDWGTMTGLYYIESADNGVTWRKSDGIPISLPVKRSTAERVLTINENSGYVNQNGACVDANNTFLTTMTQRRTVDGKTTDWIVLIKQNSSGWTVDYIFDTGVMAESSGIYTGIYGRPMVFVNRMNEPIVLFNSTLQDRSIIAINTKTKERKILTSGVHHSVVCDNEYARDFFVFKTLFINGQSTTKIPQTANRYFELFIYESKLL